MSAETASHLVIPTSRRDKVGVGWSYPVGAEAVSAALQGVPQFNAFTIDFMTPDQISRRADGRVGVMSASFRRAGASIHRPRGDPRIGLAVWHVTVRAVPRAHRATIRRVLEESGLAAIRSWLVELGPLDGREGEARLVLHYDLIEGSLLHQREDHLLPTRER